MDNVTPPKPGFRAASSFVYDKAFVNGEWVAASSGKTFEGKEKNYAASTKFILYCINHLYI